MQPDLTDESDPLDRCLVAYGRGSDGSLWWFPWEFEWWFFVGNLNGGFLLGIDGSFNGGKSLCHSWDFSPLSTGPFSVANC